MALDILVVGLTIIFVFGTATIPSYVTYAGGSISVVILVALFVTLIPTTIGAVLSAIGIAGMGRLVRFNVLAMSGRAVEAAGDVDTLLLDKTGTITLGNRQATAFRPVRGVTDMELADAAQLASLADETPEGRSIVVLAKEKYGIRSRDMAELAATFIPFTAQNRMSGVDAGASAALQGAVDARGQVAGHSRRTGQGQASRDVRRRHQRGTRARTGGCRCRHEHRHAGGARGGQHGRSRLQSDQVDRGGRNRQAAVDDPWCDHPVLDRQRRCEIFRHHPREASGDLSATRPAQRT